MKLYFYLRFLFGSLMLVIDFQAETQRPSIKLDGFFVEMI